MNTQPIPLEARRAVFYQQAFARCVALTLILCAASAPATARAASYPQVGADNDRVVELVSNPDNLNPVTGAVLSADGDRALYRVFGGGPDTSFGAAGVTLAQRTASGWQTSNALPPRTAFADTAAYAGDAFLFAASSDLRALSVDVSPPLGARGFNTFLRYTSDTGELVRGYTFTPSGSPEALSSANQMHVVGIGRRTLVAEDTAPGGGLYDFGTGQPELIGLLPGDVVPSCGVAPIDFVNTNNGSLWQNWLSVDGSRVFFHTRGNGDCDANPRELYMREGGAHGVSRWISGPATAGPQLGARFSSATPDGSKVFFTTATRLDPRDTNTGTDIYRYTVGTGNRCITCAVPDAQVNSLEPGIRAPERILAAETGERVYFTSTEALAAGAMAGEVNIYVWSQDRPDELRFVASAGDLSTTTPRTNATASPDGSVFVFAAADRDLDALTNSDSRGLAQYYRYDDRTGSLVCASCPQGRATVAVVLADIPSSSLVRFLFPSPLTRDGRSFFFKTSEALVARDSNAGSDIYEWRDGRVGLITDGISERAVHVIRGLSADGRDLLFDSSNDLAPSVRTGGRKLYDARIGGGFPEPPSALSRCASDGCQVAPVGRPGVSASAVAGGDDSNDSSPRVTFSGGRLSASQRVALAAGRRVIVAVHVNRAGVVRASLGRYGTAASVRAMRAGTVRLTLRLSKAARQRLVGKGRLTVTLTVRLAGSAQARVQKLDLRRPR
jgi:hypothetical protein